MPAVFDSLLYDRGLSAHNAWRVSFVVPFILITTTALLMLLLCPDTPYGKWSDRLKNTDSHIDSSKRHIVSTTGGVLEPTTHGDGHHHQSHTDPEKKTHDSESDDAEAQVGETKVIDEYHHEVIAAPTIKSMMKVILSPNSIVLAFCYFNSFGAELAINSILGAYYLKNFSYLGQTGSGKWAAMFGLLNIVARPFGGIVCKF